MPRTYKLDSDAVHYAWDNALPPRLHVDSGDTVIISCRDSSDGRYRRGMTTADMRPYTAKGHPLTGPIAVRDAHPADVLQIDVLDLVPGEVGYTSFVPGRGLLSDDFPRPSLKMWELDGRFAELRSGIRIPLEPFLGVMGVAVTEPGEHSTIPPRAQGGNMDVKQLTKGSTLYLPIQVEGALFSAGDGHAAQGDGEVCITAIETTMTATLRLSVVRDHACLADGRWRPLRHDGYRTRSHGGEPIGGALDDRSSRRRARTDPRGGLRPLQCRGRSEDQRSRRRAELGGLGLPSARDLRVNVDGAIVHSRGTRANTCLDKYFRCAYVRDMAARAVLPEPAHAPGLGRLVMQVSRELRTLADRQLAPLGLTMQQAELVIATFLHGEKGSRHLTSLVLTDEAGVSRLVDRLEAKGLVRRRPSPRDRRSRALELTPAGRAVVARMRRRRAVVDQRLREGISADDIAATRDVLLRVLDNIARAARAVA